MAWMEGIQEELVDGEGMTAQRGDGG